MMDHDPVSQAMKEAQRLSAEPIGPNPFKREPAGEVLREVVDHKQQQKTITGQDSSLANLDPNRAIQLRWMLRDIKAKRTNLSPVSPYDLRILIELGLVEVRDGVPSLTNAGVRAID